MSQGRVHPMSKNKESKVCRSCQGLLDKYGCCLVEAVWLNALPTVEDQGVETENVTSPCEIIRVLHLENQSKVAELESYYSEREHYKKQIESADEAYKELNELRVLYTQLQESVKSPLIYPNDWNEWPDQELEDEYEVLRDVEDPDFRSEWGKQVLEERTKRLKSIEGDGVGNEG